MDIRYIDNPAELPVLSLGSLISIDLETYGFANQFRQAFSPIAVIYGVQPMLSPRWFTEDIKVTGYVAALDTLCCQVRIVSIQEEHSKTTWVIDAVKCGYENVLALLHGHPLMGHNLAFDLKILFRLGLPDPPYVRDTMVAGRVGTAGMREKNGRQRVVSLSRLLEDTINVKIDKNLGGGAKSNWSDLNLTDDQIKYAGHDVCYLLPMYRNLVERLEVQGLTTTNTLEQDFIIPCTRMALAGMTVDAAQWEDRTQETGKNLVEVAKQFREMVPLPSGKTLRTVRVLKSGKLRQADLDYNAKIEKANEYREWNVSSWQQIRDLMNILGVPLPLKVDDVKHRHVDRPVPKAKYAVPVKKKAEPVHEEDVSLEWKFDEEVELANEYVYNDEADAQVKAGEVRVRTDRITLTILKDQHPCIPVILKLRDHKKEFTSFGSNWLTQHLRGNRVYADWRQLGTLTGRMAVSNPNLQQVPRGEVRLGLIAPEGYKLVRADYSQIEVRIAAKISNDQLLLDIFNTGKDVHEETARRVLGKETVTKAERQIGKSLVFGLLYSMSAKALRVYCYVNFGVDFSLEQATAFRDRFFAAYVGLAAWHRREKLRSMAADDTRTLIGRRRWIREEEGNRMGLCLNSPVQGSGADMLKIAVVNWYPGWDYGERLTAMVHDELIFEVPEDRAQNFAGHLREHMIAVGKDLLDPVPCDASVKVSNSWGE